MHGKLIIVLFSFLVFLRYQFEGFILLHKASLLDVHALLAKFFIDNGLAILDQSVRSVATRGMLEG